MTSYLYFIVYTTLSCCKVVSRFRWLFLHHSSDHCHKNLPLLLVREFFLGIFIFVENVRIFTFKIFNDRHDFICLSMSCASHCESSHFPNDWYSLSKCVLKFVRVYSRMVLTYQDVDSVSELLNCLTNYVSVNWL